MLNNIGVSFGAAVIALAGMALKKNNPYKEGGGRGYSAHQHATKKRRFA